MRYINNNNNIVSCNNTLLDMAWVRIGICTVHSGILMDDYKTILI